MLHEQFLDVSELEAPEPFERATALLLQMKPGEYLRLLHRRVPYPLFDFCKQLSLTYAVVEGTSCAWEIIIYFVDDSDSLQHAGIL